MKIGNVSLIIENILLKDFDYEGFLMHPTKPLGMLVLSSQDSSFTLHIYKLQSEDEHEFHIVKKLTTRTFASLTSMQYFLSSFSTYKANEFMKFLNRYE